MFAGNAASCILRFSRKQQTFIADGKMMLESQPTAGGESKLRHFLSHHGLAHMLPADWGISNIIQLFFA